MYNARRYDAAEELSMKGKRGSRGWGASRARNELIAGSGTESGGCICTSLHAPAFPNMSQAENTGSTKRCLRAPSTFLPVWRIDSA